MTLAPQPSRPAQLLSRFGVEAGRRAMVDDARQENVVREEDTRADGVIGTLARDALRGGFDLRVEGPRAEEAQAIADQLLTRLV